MPRILAIEADPTRRTLLSALVREHVSAELVIADSVKSAIAQIAQRLPDVILAPALLSPADGAELDAHVRQLRHAPYLQLMTIPAFDMLSPPPSEGRGLFGAGIFRRRPDHVTPRYDREMVGAQIADVVERARGARIEYAGVLVYQAELEEIAKRKQARNSGKSTALVLAGGTLQDELADERRSGLRRRQGDVPWLSAARLAWGTEISLVNISNRGVLLESGSKLAPGSTTELHLTGPDTSLVVPVRFIRSEIAKNRRARREISRCSRVRQRNRSCGAETGTTSAGVAATGARRSALGRSRGRAGDRPGARQVRPWPARSCGSTRCSDTDLAGIVRPRDPVLRRSRRRPRSHDPAGRVRPWS